MEFLLTQNNLILFSNPDKNQINDNYITYNKPETEDSQ